MRSTKELLELMLDNTSQIATGLCRLTDILLIKELITYRERIILQWYIDTHRPSKFSSFKAWKNRNSRFYWPKGDKKSRIKWLKYHIKKLS